VAAATVPAAELVFAYAELLRPDVQLDTFGRLVETDDDVLTGYALSYLDDEDPRAANPSGHTVLPRLRHAQGALDRVPGRVLHLTQDELDAADEYQSPLHRRTSVLLSSGRRAWVYLPRPDAAQ
jgi:hypothetical protein